MLRRKRATCLACALHRFLALRILGTAAFSRKGASLMSIMDSAAVAAVDLLGRGKDGTLVYPATQIPARFAPDACVIIRQDAAKNANKATTAACIDASDGAALRRAGLGDDVALKDVRDEAAAKAEAAIHAHLRSCFARGHKMRLCCLHPRVFSVWVDDHVLIPMRVGTPIDKHGAGTSDKDNHKQYSAAALLSLARGVLGALSIMHANRVLHLDVKPQNIMTISGSRSASSSYVLADYDLTAHFDDVLDAMRDGPVPVGTPGYISPLLLGRMEPAYVRVCALASSDMSRTACARFGVAFPRLDDEVDWVERFALMRHRAMSSTSAALELLPQIDLHSLAVTLHRLMMQADGPRASSAASRRASQPQVEGSDRLLALIGGLIGGAFDDAADAIKVCGKA